MLNRFNNLLKCFIFASGLNKNRGKIKIINRINKQIMTEKELNTQNRQVQYKLIGVRLENLALTYKTLQREEGQQETLLRIQNRMNEIIDGMDWDQVQMCLSIADVTKKNRTIINNLLKEKDE